MHRNYATKKAFKIRAVFLVRNSRIMHQSPGKYRLRSVCPSGWRVAGPSGMSRPAAPECSAAPRPSRGGAHRTRWENCGGGENIRPPAVGKNLQPLHSSSCHQVRIACKLPPAVNAASSAMIAMLSRSSAAHRARSRDNSAAKDLARAKIAHAVAASSLRQGFGRQARAFFRRLYHVEREMPSASHGCFAGRRGPIPCALRQRSERKRAFSRRSESVIMGRSFRKAGSVALFVTGCVCCRS